MATKQELELKLKELIKHLPPRIRGLWRKRLLATLEGKGYVAPEEREPSRAAPPFKEVLFRWGDQQYAQGGRDVELERVIWVRDLLGRTDMLTFGALDELVGYEERKRVVRLAIRRGTECWHTWDAPISGTGWWDAKMGHPYDPVRPD